MNIYLFIYEYLFLYIQNGSLVFCYLIIYFCVCNNINKSNNIFSSYLIE
jgi:hypothetical protein